MYAFGHSRPPHNRPPVRRAGPCCFRLGYRRGRRRAVGKLLADHRMRLVPVVLNFILLPDGSC
jgi:hypothetical protein